MTPPLSRRNFIASVGAGTALSAVTPRLPAALGGAPVAFRFVHLTDIHVQTELRADRGLKECLKAVEALRPRPDFILTGGDLVMDAFEQDASRATSLFRLYKQVLSDHTGLSVRQCIGNHDVFAWGKKDADPQHPQYGKQMVRDALELPQTYYRFDHHGWRFFVLDDIQPAPNRGYQAYLDEPQWHWLEDELAAKDPDMPAVVVCHIPILSVTVFGAANDGAYRVSNGVMCRDALKLADLLSRNNVRLALSGHTHDLDRIEYRNVSFICDGAVCGAWWKGKNKGVSEGFGVIDLHADGIVTHRYHTYGWNAES